MLSYQTTVNKEKAITLYNTGFGFGRGWRVGGGIATGETSTIRTGELALDIYGVDSKQLLWRGVISDTIPGKTEALTLAEGSEQWGQEAVAALPSAGQVVRRFPIKGSTGET